MRRAGWAGCGARHARGRCLRSESRRLSVAMGGRAKYTKVETTEVVGDYTPRQGEEAADQEGQPLMVAPPTIAAAGNTVDSEEEDRVGLLGPGEASAAAVAGAGGIGTGGTPGQATTLQTYATFFKVFFGIGILAMPHGFVMAGYAGGALGITCIAWVSYYCITLLLASRDRIVELERAAAADGLSLLPRVNTSGGAILLVDVAEAAFGRKGRQLAEFCILVSQVCLCHRFQSLRLPLISEYGRLVCSVVVASPDWLRDFVPDLYRRQLGNKRGPRGRAAWARRGGYGGD